MMSPRTAQAIIGTLKDAQHKAAILDPNDEEYQDGIQELIDHLEANYL